MSSERDELRRLVEGLPDEEVPVVLAEVRRRTGSAVAAGVLRRRTRHTH